MTNGERELHGTLESLDQFPDWDARIDRFPQKRIFHEAAWLRFLEEDQGGRAVVLRIVDHEGGERALWPGLVVRKGPLRIFGSPLRGWGTVAMGPLYHECDPELLLAAAEAAFTGAGIHHWEFVSEVLSAPADPEGRGYRLESSDTHRIRLDPVEGRMWENLQQRCRTSVRKASKCGLACRIAEDGRFLGILYELVAEIFARSKTTPPYDARRLRRLWDALFPLGKAFGIEVWHAEHLAAAGLFISDGRQVYAWAEASVARFNAYGPNNLLYWEAMRHCGRIGAAFLHLPGAPGSSIGKFKTSFNPEVLSFPFWIRDRNPLLRWGRRLYQEMHSARARWRYFSSRQAPWRRGRREDA